VCNTCEWQEFAALVNYELERTCKRGIMAYQQYYTGIHLNEAEVPETHFLQHQNKQYKVKCPYTNIQP
jgi:hypothetical protein